MTRLLLIDKRVREYQKLIDCAAPSVICMTFDYEGDTLSTILARLPPGPFESVGIVQDGTNYMTEYRIVANQQPADVSSKNPDMSTWADVRTFLTGLQTPVVDFISCMLLSNPSFATAMTRLEADLGIDLRASRDRTGNLAAGGNWIQESDGVDIKGLYFTDAIAGYMHIMYSFMGNATNQSPFLNVEANGSNADWCMVTPMKKVLNPLFVTTSNPSSISVWGNTINGGSGAPPGVNYKAIASSNTIFVALDTDGGITQWGNLAEAAPTDNGYTTIVTNFRAVAALKSDGSITAWGNSAYGGSGAPLSGVYTAIASSVDAFAALRNDGAISAWGNLHGGPGAPVGTGFTAIASSEYSFAALKTGGYIVDFGQPLSIIAPTDGGYIAIASTQKAFAALKLDGSITAWGDPANGGSGAPSSDVYTAIVSTGFAFAALKLDGSITAWGNSFYGGSGAPVGTGFKAIASNFGTFAAIKLNGTIATWGLWDTNAPTESGFTKIAASGDAFAALKTDGSITVWGLGIGGGTGAPSTGFYTAIVGSGSAFTALRNDGSVVTWGSISEPKALTPTDTGYTAIISAADAFAAFNRTLSSDTSIQSITVNGIAVSTGSTTYLPALTDSVEVMVTPTSSAATVSVTGNTDLQPGLNTVIISVTAEDESNTIYNIYLYVELPCCPYTVRITETNKERIDHNVGNLLRQAIKDGRQPHMDASTWVRSRK